MISINYRWLFLYKLALQLSFGLRYRERYLAVSKLIPDDVHVVDPAVPADSESHFERASVRARDLGR